MERFAWILAFLGLREVDLTVRAQAVDPMDVDGVIYPAFLQTENVNSMKVAEVTTRSYRQVAGRRPWDTDGSRFVQLPGDMRDAEFTPIDMYDFIGEKALYELFAFFGAGIENDATRQMVGRQLLQSVPDRIVEMAKAIERRLNIESANAWALGNYTITDPQNTAVATVSFGYSASRYQTAVTAWDDAGKDAVDEFVTWLRAARQKIGSLGGARMSTKVLLELLKDAPVTINTMLKMSTTDLEQYIAQQVGVGSFRIVIDDYTYETAPGTSVRYWPVGHVAAIPSDRYVGTMNFAPVVRAAQIAGAVPEARVNVRGAAAFYEAFNGGKALKYSVQRNAYPWLNEQKLYVIDTGIT